MDGTTVGSKLDIGGGGWLDDGTLDTILEINQECLKLILAMAPRARAQAGPPERFWTGLERETRASLANSPYLLADARFDDRQHWATLTGQLGNDQTGPLAAPLFVGPGAQDFIRRVLVFGWHLARFHPRHARIVLGMHPACAELVGHLRLMDLDWLASHHPECVRLRWERQPRAWRHLLRRSPVPGCEALTLPGLRGLQLLAGNALGKDL